MKIPSIIILLFISLQWAEGAHWTTIQFSKGDILQCDMNIFAFHVLLATSSTHVIHMVGDKTSAKGLIVEETWNSYHNREGEGQTNCRVAPKAVHPDLAVEKARQDKQTFQGRQIYYNLLTCNCEHWVNKWAKGLVFSDQSLHGASNSCDVYRNPITNSDWSRFGGRPMTTNGGRCETQCTLRDDGKHYCGGSHCSPRVGTTYRGNSCYGNCQPYLDYFFCYTDSSNNWDYCGPTY